MRDEVTTHINQSRRFQHLLGSLKKVGTQAFELSHNPDTIRELWDKMMQADRTEEVVSAWEDKKR